MQEFFEHLGFKAGWSAFLGCFAWFLGGLDVTLLAMFVLYVVDFALGAHRAWATGTISGAKAQRGLIKFVLYVLVILCANMLDLSLSRSFPFLRHYVRDCMVVFVSINEFLSVCTHLAAMGLRVPEGLQIRLRTYRDTAADCGGLVGPYGGIPGTPGQPPQPGPKPSDVDDGGL